jgi:peptidoglycan/xylan/chitin deacetylase (PgdA/CDA1 family)
MKVTLTFDNGPTLEVTPHVLECLRARRLTATFFPLGKNLAQEPLMELARRAYADGHRLGNHSYNHGTPFGMLEAPEEALEEIVSTDRLLGHLRGSEPLFRPFGRARIGPHLLNRPAWNLLRELGFTCITWNYIAREKDQADTWYHEALAACRERNWTVIVMHDIPTGAMRMLDHFLDGLMEAGAEFSQEFPPDCVAMRRGVPTGPADHLMPKDGARASDPTLDPRR